MYISGSSLGLTYLLSNNSNQICFQKEIQNVELKPIAAAHTMGASFILFSDNSLYLYRGKISSLEGKTIINLPLLNNELVIKLACGCGHASVLTNNGRVFQLGLGRSENTLSSTFSLIEMKKKFVVDISCHADSTVMYTSQNELWAIGKNTYGELGTVKSISKLLKIECNFLKTEKIKLFESGYASLWVVTSNERIFFIGRTDEICNQNTFKTHFPGHTKGNFIELTKFFPQDEKIIGMACGSYHGLIMTEKKNVYFYSRDNTEFFIKLSPPKDKEFRNITTMYYDSIVECSDGNVYFITKMSSNTEYDQPQERFKIVGKRAFVEDWSIKNHIYFSSLFRNKVLQILLSFSILKKRNNKLIPPKPIIYLIISHISKSEDR